MRARAVRPDDATEWLRMRNLLWPPEPGDDHAAEIARFFAGDPLVSCPGERAAVFVVERDDGAPASGGGARLGGFVECGLRPFADGCDTRPVGYIEGWFVDEDLRRTGVGRELLRAAEEWARAHGATEMGSDCIVGNDLSLRAHLALGYVEHERMIHFTKRL